jgi:hypothetical protein
LHVCVVVRPGVGVEIAADGTLILVSPEGTCHVYPPEATAIWIALRQHGGDITAAAERLAAAWASETVLLRLEIDEYVDNWQRAGLVSGHHRDTHCR